MLRRPRCTACISTRPRTRSSSRSTRRPRSPRASRPTGHPPARGKPARRDSEYLRNATTNLFAALQVHHGEVSGMTSATRNRWDFLALLGQLEAEIPANQQLIAILDNLSTHKTREIKAWLTEHPRSRFVFTPKHASWTRGRGSDGHDEG